MNLGDHRLGEVPDAEAAFHHVPRPLALAAGGVKRQFAHARQIVARGKTRPGAAQDNDPHGRVGVGRLEGGEDLTAQGVGKGVALGRPVEGKAAHQRRRIVGKEDRLVVHLALLALR